jgi:polyvinyl alcohol dehydrogenase (cytochrome)
MYGPAGAAIFAAPTIDAARGLIYAATGDAYTNVPTRYSNALIAFDLATGARRWSHQVLADDAWIVGCDAAATGNCPSPLGPDHDFASAVIQRTLPSGRQVLVAAAKSGIVYAFDPARRGRLLWQVRLGKGGEQGGVLWGPAADPKAVYVALSDVDLQDMNAGGGLTALRLADGARLWHTPAPDPVCAPGLPYCSRAHVAAVTAMPGIVFSGGLDGRIRAYAADDGRIVWEFATAQEFAAVNGAIAHGGSVDAGGQVVVDGILYVVSGSTRQPGNALLAFSVDGR